MTLADEYIQACEILEREVTDSGIKRFENDKGFREQTRRKVMESEYNDDAE